MNESAKATEKMTVFILKGEHVDTAFAEGRLATLGYDIIGTAQAPGEGLITADVAPDVILVAAQSVSPDYSRAVEAMKAAYAPCDITVIALLEKQSPVNDAIYDAVLMQPVHPVQIHNRIKSLVRLKRIETALITRRETLVADFGVNCAVPDTMLGAPFRILFVGSATPEFIILLNVLQEKNVEIFAAFTSFTAFDYLHDNDFDAVVLNATKSLEPALSVSETMQRTPRLYNVPILVMTDETHSDVVEVAITKGARDVFYANASQYEISGRILELANFYRIHTGLKKELAAIDALACFDPPTKLYNRDFLHAHLKRVSEFHSKIGETVSMLMLRLRPSSMEFVEAAQVRAAIDHVGRLLKSLVRAEDITARMSGDVFVVAFPGQARASVEVVEQRIKETIENAAFTSGKTGQSPLTLEAEFLLSEKMTHESSDHFITRTEQELMGGASDFRIAN